MSQLIHFIECNWRDVNKVGQMPTLPLYSTKTYDFPDTIEGHTYKLSLLGVTSRFLAYRANAAAWNHTDAEPTAYREACEIPRMLEVSNYIGTVCPASNPTCDGIRGYPLLPSDYIIRRYTARSEIFTSKMNSIPQSEMTIAYIQGPVSFDVNLNTDAAWLYIAANGGWRINNWLTFAARYEGFFISMKLTDITTPLPGKN